MSDINILSCLHVDTTKLEEAKVVDETQDSITYEVKTALRFFTGFLRGFE